jgi:hypothetical protein
LIIEVGARECLGIGGMCSVFVARCWVLGAGDWGLGAGAGPPHQMD